MHNRINNLSQTAVVKGIPLNSTFELTSRCNLNCKMCYIHRPDCFQSGLSLKPVSYWLSMAEQAKALGTLVLVITGGETFLYPEAETLLEELMKMGFIISLNTNGTLLDDRRIAWLDEHRPAKINISLYGACDETYKKLCGCENGFTVISSVIDKLLAHGHNVYLNGTLTQDNVDDIPAMAEFAKKRGLVLHNTSYLFPPGRYGIFEAPSRLMPAEATQADLLMERLQIGEEAQISKCVQQVRLVEATVKGQIAPHGGFHSGDGCSRSNCGGGRNSFAITWDGKMMPCVTNPGIVVPLEDKTLAEGWDELRTKVAQMKLPDGCITCPYQMICNACPATIYNEAGNYETLSTYTCAYIRENYLARVELLKQHAEKIK